MSNDGKPVLHRVVSRVHRPTDVCHQNGDLALCVDMDSLSALVLGEHGCLVDSHIRVKLQDVALDLLNIPEGCPLYKVPGRMPFQVLELVVCGRGSFFYCC